MLVSWLRTHAHSLRLPILPCAGITNTQQSFSATMRDLVAITGCGRPGASLERVGSGLSPSIVLRFVPCLAGSWLAQQLPPRAAELGTGALTALAGG
jgi:hypothetical protein